MDAKGRVSVPVQFRRAMEEGLDGRRPELHIVYGDPRRKFLECYTPESFAEVEAKIDAMPRGDKTRQTLQYHLISQSYSTEIDSDGRLILPQKCRDKARLESEALFVATGDTFQIWNPQIFETEREAEMREAIEALPPDVDILALLDGPPGR
jgi:transcriptional regulator MraZ